MSIEEFIIVVFCWVDDNLKNAVGGARLRRRGFAPRLGDSEVIALEIVGEFLGQDGDEAIFEYFKRHWAGWFPGLGDRSRFVRQAANLWRVKQLLHGRRLAELGAGQAQGHVIDGFPMPVCRLARASRSRVFQGEADFGYCASQDEYFFGLKGHLLIGLRGGAVGMAVTAPGVDEREAAHDLPGEIEGLLLGDKGYLSARFQDECRALGINLRTPLRKSMEERRPRWWLKLLLRLRRRVETVIAQFEQRFGLAKIRARDTWHLTNRVARKMLAHTLAVWLNIRQGHEPDLAQHSQTPG